MSSLLPNHHRSTSDRLLNNYLSSQKQLTTALLTLLSHSHSSTSSLLAYVTSSSGVAYPVRRSVQHAAFEGPMNQDSGEDYDSINGGATEAKWHEYIASLEHFRKELKEVHGLEEELSQVKKDREILVSRLIKATKSRPTKADIAAAAKASHSESGRTRHSNSSVLSFGSDHSGTTAGGGKSKRAEKLAEAQAEVLGCEEHLRGLEVRLEQERNKVMRHGLLERFRAMEDVGRMWQRQARLGISELERAAEHDDHMHNSNAYEVESNGSIAPSQSASQVGYGSDGEGERRRSKAHGRGGHVAGMAGSVTGSIAEEDENSSSDDDGNLVVHENKRPGASPAGNDLRSRSQSTIVPYNNQSTGMGVPSITNIKAKPQTRRQHSGSSGSSVGRAPGRRTQSELGYNPPRARQNRLSIRRTPSRGAQSDASSSVRSVGRNKKRGGFFASIAKIFKGKSSGSTAGSIRGGRRGGADSPPLTQRNKAGWSTRTDDNIRRAVSNVGTSRGVSSGRRTRNADYSSSDDEMGGGNLVAVTNRGNNTWSVDNAGRTPAAVAPSASKPKKARSDLGAGEKARSNSQTTITSASGKVTSKPPGVSSQPVTRSNTVKSTASGVNGNSQRTRHGSITRAGARGSTIGAPPSIAGVLEGVVPKAPSSVNTATNRSSQPKMAEVPKAPSSQSGPRMADIPKAPTSQVTPKMYMATAPPPTKAPLLQPPPPVTMSQSASAPVGLGDGYVPKPAASSTSKMSKASKATITAKSSQPVAQSQPKEAPASTASVSKSQSALAGLNLGAPVGMSQANESQDSISARSHTPLPPSKTLSPPAKSAMRASSPIPMSSPEFEAPPPAFMISAPGSVIQSKTDDDVFGAPKQPAVKPVTATPATPQAQSAQANRPSTPATDADSVYESAVEEDAETDDEKIKTEPVQSSAATAVTAANGNAHDDDDDGSSVASDSTAGPGQNSKYKVVENTEGPASRMRQASAAGTSAPVQAENTPASVPVPAPAPVAVTKPKEVVKDDYVPAAAASMTGSAIERRKSVRMNVPPSPGTPTTTAPPESPTPENKSSTTWSSRVGRTADSSDEEDNAAYAKARRHMNRYSSLSASAPASATTTTKKKKRASKA